MDYKICLLSKIFGTAKVARSQKIDSVLNLDQLEEMLKNETGNRQINKYINQMEGLGLCFYEDGHWRIVQPEQLDYKTSIKMKLANDLLLQYGLMKNFPEKLIREGFVKSGREAMMKNLGHD